MEFNNEDLIITDPCYVLKDEDYSKWIDIIEEEGCYSIDGLNFIYSNTIYGDWSCTTYDSEKNILGKFCADAGLVGVFKADDILKYNPEFFKEFMFKDWCVTLIRHFTGTVNITNNGDEVHVIGVGNINFYTEQTGL